MLYSITKKITLLSLFTIFLYTMIKISNFILALLTYLYLYIYLIIFIFLIFNIFYAFWIIKKNIKSDESLTMKKILNNKMFQPYELIFDFITAIKKKNIEKLEFISLLIMLLISPLINISLLCFLILFLINFVIYLNEIIISLVFNKDIILNGKSNPLSRLINIPKIFSFHFLYILLDNRGNFYEKLKTNFKNNLNTFLLTRLYGKSLLIIKIYIRVYYLILKILKKDYKNKKLYALPLILLLEFKDLIDNDINSYNIILIKTLKNKRIIITKKKIKTNPSDLTKKIIQKEGHDIENYLIKEFIKPLTIKENILKTSFYGNFKSVKLNNKLHLSLKLSNINNEDCLMQVFTSKENVYINNKLYKTHNPILSKNYEEMIQLQEKEEKYLTYISINKNQINEHVPVKIISDYTINSPVAVIFFELQQKIILSRKIFYDELRIFIHDKRGLPTHEVNFNSLTKKVNLHLKTSINKNNFLLHNTIDTKIQEIIKNQNLELTIEEHLYLKNELINFSYTLFTNLPTTEFQDKCITEYVNAQTTNKYEAANYLQELKRLI